jgi:hypothetical protein
VGGLRSHDQGFEVQLAYNDEFFASRRFAAGAQALAHANAIRKLLEGAGFRLVTATA